MSSTDSRPGDVPVEGAPGPESTPPAASRPGAEGPSGGRVEGEAAVDPIEPPAASGALSKRAAARRDRTLGFAIIVFAFLAALFISWKASQVVKPRVASEPAPPTSDGLVGYPDRVDPLATLELARQVSERQQLRRIVASGVASDGTVDLAGARSSIRYDFDSAAGEGPEAPRPVGTVRRGTHCGRQTVHVRKKGIYASRDRPRSPCSAARGEPLPAPRCSLKQIWQLALERGASPKGRATIDYFRAQGGPAWRFALPGSRVRFTLFGDCETELEGKAARPLIP